jgi:3',5'-cyclic-AMP phosphodiesterase
MTAPLLIAQISDLHIKRGGERAYGVVDTAAALRPCIEALNGLQPRPALVVASGDLVDGGGREEYNHLTSLLAALEIPIAVLPGNHDERDAMRRAFPAQSFASPAGPMNARVDVGPVDLLLIDSTVPGEPHGELADETLAWLDEALASNPARPALLFLHHPPFQTGIWHMDRQNLLNTDALVHVVRRHARTRLIAAGHVHRAVVTQVAGIPATICPAPNHAVDLDLGHIREPSFRLEPPGFHLHACFADGAVVTHAVAIGDCGPPYPFFGPDGKLL